ncbi:MAG: prephenate/arogenate dehydrogenase family protein [Pseudomonadota bacterium]
MTDPLFPRVTLIGLGLLGASLGLAIKRAGLAREVVGTDHDEAVRATALSLGIVDETKPTAVAAAENADLVILCTPVGTLTALTQELAPALKAGAILTDVGSVKATFARDAAVLMPKDVHFIPGHPVAGTEQSGPEAGFAELFDGRWCILTPPDGTDETALSKLTSFWEGCGAKVEVMNAAHHDLVLAITSHIPHLIAYNIVGTAADLETVTQSEVIKYSAGGFRDFTRIAASNPEMWRDIFLSNKDAVLEMLGRFSEDLSALQRAIRYGDADGLHTLFTRTQAIRKQIIDAGQESPEANFGRQTSSKE